MAVTFTVVKRARVGNHREVYADMVGPASYTTGGETLTAAQYGQLLPEIGSGAAAAAFTNVFFFDAEVGVATVPAFLSAALDKTNNKMAYTTAGAQTSAAANLSAQTVRVRMAYQFGT